MLQQIFLRSGVEAGQVFASAHRLGYRAVTITSTDGQSLPVPPFVGFALFDRAEPDAPVAYSAEFGHKERPASKISYFRNRQIGVDHVEVTGPQAASVRRELASTLTHYETDAYERATTDRDPNERITALFQLAVGKGPVPEPRVLRLVREFLQHDNVETRKVAVLAAVFFQWPPVFAMLEERSRIEPDEDVRGQIEVALTKRDMPIFGYGQAVAQLEPHVETIWIRSETAERYLVSSIPSVVYNLSLDDVVELEERDGRWVVARVLEKAGHRTLRVDGDVDAIEAKLRSLRVRCESQTSGRLAVDVPPTTDLEAVTRTLDTAGVFWELADPRPA